MSEHHEDRIEKLTAPFYIRWTHGPDYEKAYLCVEDGEPDMRDFATVSYGQARLFKEALEIACVSSNLAKDIADMEYESRSDAGKWNVVLNKARRLLGFPPVNPNR